MAIFNILPNMSEIFQSEMEIGPKYGQAPIINLQGWSLPLNGLKSPSICHMEQGRTGRKNSCVGPSWFTLGRALVL